MINRIQKTEITIFNTQRGESPAELKRIAAVRGLDIVADGNDWIIGGDMGKITYHFDGESFWYTMVLMNETPEAPAKPATVTKMEKPLNEQLADLAELFVKTGKLDARKLSKEAKEWALKRQWIVRDNGRLRFANYQDLGNYFVSRYDLPEETILILMERAGVWNNGNSIGFSVTKMRFWELLDIYPNGTYGFNESAIREMEQVLMRLDSAGLITFMAAGRIWSIYKQEQS